MPCSPDMEEETMRFLFQLDHRDGLSKLIGLNFFLLVAPNLFGKLKKSEKPPPTKITNTQLAVVNSCLALEEHRMGPCRPPWDGGYLSISLSRKRTRPYPAHTIWLKSANSLWQELILKLSLALHLKNCAIIHYVVIPTHRSWWTEEGGRSYPSGLKSLARCKCKHQPCSGL